MKILQIVENLDYGTVENWLLNFFIKSKEEYPEFEWTFFCILPEKGVFEDSFIKQGANVIHSKFLISNKLQFILNLRKVIFTGKFNIIHSHHDYLSGFYYLSTIGLKTNKIVTHIHNSNKHLPIKSKFLFKPILWFFWKLTCLFSDDIIAVSHDCLNSFLNKKYDKKGHVVYCGLDFVPFFDNLNSKDLRHKLKFDSNAIVLLFVGRLEPEKNPIFLIDILSIVVDMDPKKEFHVVYAGIGMELDRIKEYANSKGMNSRVHFTGFIQSIANVYDLGNIFIFPRFESKMEGLGLVIVEAQAAGLPILTTRAIPKDAFLITNSIKIIETKDDPKIWANELIKMLNKFPNKNKLELEFLQNSRFSIYESISNIFLIYKNKINLKS